jgi:antitoxin PrlF
MAFIVEEVSTITSKGQTTIPKTVRQALGVADGDKIAFRIDDKGVTLKRAADEVSDPALTAFLCLLAKDVASHPEKISAFTPALAERITSLIGTVEFDPDAEIEGEVDL